MIHRRRRHFRQTLRSRLAQKSHDEAPSEKRRVNSSDLLIGVMRRHKLKGPERAKICMSAALCGITDADGQMEKKKRYAPTTTSQQKDGVPLQLCIPISCWTFHGSFLNAVYPDLSYPCGGSALIAKTGQFCCRCRDRPIANISSHGYRPALSPITSKLHSCKKGTTSWRRISIFPTRQSHIYIGLAWQGIIC